MPEFRLIETQSLSPREHWVRERHLPEELRVSLEEAGILVPLLVLSGEAGGPFVVADGWRRVLWARERGIRRLPAVVVENGSAPLLALTANAHGLSAYERTRWILDYLAELWRLDGGWLEAGERFDRLYRHHVRGQRTPLELETTHEWRTALEVHRIALTSPHTTRTRYVKLLRQLPKEAHQLIEAGRLTASEAMHLLSRGEEAGKTFSEMLLEEGLGPHFGSLRHLVGGDAR